MLLAVAMAGSISNPSTAQADDRRIDRVEWDDDWMRVQPWEYVFTAASLGGSFALRFGVDHPDDANWTGNFLGDFEVAEALAVRDEGARDAWQLVGDIPFYGAMVYPVIDSLILVPMIHGNWDVAWQLFMMNLESFAVVAPMIWVSQYFVRRPRPFTRTICQEPGGAQQEDGCDPNNEEYLRSFPGGHVAIATTTAALTCTHHAHLPLYGGGAGDVAACGIAVGAAGAVTVARFAGEKHYLSDTVVGIGMGVVAGWLVPTALHYGFSDDEDEDEILVLRTSNSRRRGLAVTLMPVADPDNLGVAALGRFE